MVFLGDLVQFLTRKFHPHYGRAEHPCPLLTLLPEEPGLRLEDGHQDISARKQPDNWRFQENWRAPRAVLREGWEESKAEAGGA